METKKSGSGRPTAISHVLRGLMLVIFLGMGSPISSEAAVPGEPRLDLNHATEQELAALPGIGQVRAAAIVRRRAQVPFDRVEELLDVPGIGPAVFAALEDRVRTTPGGRSQEE